ncbi:hypothetical protein [Mariniblastus fucicola]|uniref:hypothetical protein n=1 Tax=Mariniblastus fucicola TaxID=980251 RepID=UPI0011E04AC7|nr:hypothetical protein [Mariniblastus fucicola]
MLLQESKAHAGDALPPDCCQLFSEADFAPFDSSHLLLPADHYALSSSPVKAATPCQTVFVPPSRLKWNFDYTAAKVAKRPTVKQISVIALRRHGRVCFRRSPVELSSHRTRKKHVAPVLFRGMGSVTDLSTAMRLFGQHAGTILQICITPAERLPLQWLRMVQNFMLLN